MFIPSVDFCKQPRESVNDDGTLAVKSPLFHAVLIFHTLMYSF